VPAGHSNPSPILTPGDHHVITASDATLLNGLRMPAEMLSQLSNFVPVSLEGALLQPHHLPEAVNAIFLTSPHTLYLRHDGGGYLTGLSSLLPPLFALVRTAAELARAGPPPLGRYVGRDSGLAPIFGSGILALALGDSYAQPVVARAASESRPNIGDARVRWSMVAVGEEGVSILGTDTNTNTNTTTTTNGTELALANCPY
jgi:hypothetical protein